MKTGLCRVVSLLLAGALGAAAAGKNDRADRNKEAPPRGFRILALGEPPPFRQEVRDGVRMELEVAPGSIPPRQVVVGEGKLAATVRVQLGILSDRVEIAPGVAPVVLREAPVTPGEPGAQWLKVVPPEQGDVLAVVWRDPGKLWSEPRVLLLPDGPAPFPAGQVRFLNLLPVAATAVCHEVRVELEAVRAVSRPLPPKTDLPLQLACRDGEGNLRTVHQGSIFLNPGERAQVILFRADTDTARLPVKAIIINEAAPVPPPVK